MDVVFFTLMLVVIIGMLILQQNVTADNLNLFQYKHKSKRALKLVYISGPIGDVREPAKYKERYNAFMEVQNEMKSLGYRTFNPMCNGLPKDESRINHIRKDIRMLTECDAIYLMPGWRGSYGCVCEFICAREMGFRFIIPKGTEYSIQKPIFIHIDMDLNRKEGEIDHADK